MGNNNTTELKMYKDWIYCPTCNIKLLAGVDTEGSYGLIDGFAKNTTPTAIPVEWCHILCSDELHHVETVSLDFNGNIAYTRYIHPI